MIESLSQQAIHALEDFREQWHAAKRMHAWARKRYDALPVSVVGYFEKSPSQK